MLKKLFAALVLTSAVALAPAGASAQDKMHKEMNQEKNHVKRVDRHHMMRHHGLMEHHHHHHHHHMMHGGAY